ncbi:hypothetical protein DFH07DRAFT_158966 [Mycena maculata]|uniref:Uncharacterized protein n=1 Tax=Mycena maculata TaxID=230809 RepID=A0AAD7HXU5_9AGAR|nr:hypothetical protein DFH07DRAFT_158959 [Mycena maculata]KAJ7730872.1 hypothetical protein DFH07DRAFT_158966 [Mycena maculata]
MPEAQVSHVKAHQIRNNLLDEHKGSGFYPEGHLEFFPRTFAVGTDAKGYTTISVDCWDYDNSQEPTDRPSTDLPPTPLTPAARAIPGRAPRCSSPKMQACEQPAPRRKPAHPHPSCSHASEPTLTGPPSLLASTSALLLLCPDSRIQFSVMSGGSLVTRPRARRSVLRLQLQPKLVSLTLFAPPRTQPRSRQRCTHQQRQRPSVSDLAIELATRTLPRWRPTHQRRHGHQQTQQRRVPVLVQPPAVCTSLLGRSAAHASTQRWSNVPVVFSFLSVFR